MLRQSLACVCAAVAFSVVVSGSALADEPDRAPAASQSDEDEYNFSWLDPDKKVYVLQNRKYRKGNRFAMFASGGLNLSSPYRSALVFVPRGAFWFTEQFGVEFFFASVRNSTNSTFQELKDKQNVRPFVRENINYFGALFTWTPWYAKINMFNNILYYDWFFYAGAGQSETAADQNRSVTGDANFLKENVFAFFYGTGLNFFATRQILVRLDLTGMAYSAKGADLATNRTYYNYDFTIGLGYAF